MAALAARVEEIARFLPLAATLFARTVRYSDSVHKSERSGTFKQHLIGLDRDEQHCQWPADAFEDFWSEGSDTRARVRRWLDAHALPQLHEETATSAASDPELED